MTTPDPTSELIQQASQGDNAALDQLLEQHLPRLRAFVRLQVGAAIRARESDSDIVQSVCRQVLQDIDRFEYRGAAPFRAWLYQAALSKIREKHKFHTREKRDIGREVAADAEQLFACYAQMSSPSQGAMHNERLQIFEATFDKLSEDQRQVITLARIVGLTNKEIAEQTGRNEGAVRVQLHRALAKLGVLLDGAKAW